MSDLDDALQDVARLQAEVTDLTEQATATSGALVPVGGAEVDAASMKRGLAEMRATVIRKQQELEAATGRLRGELDAQMDAARAALAPVEKFVARLGEMIDTVNLYLGRDEEIVTLRDGEPAPEGTPIVCRSMVLAMDEESAIDPEGGGIDARRIEEFDEWLMADPAHLSQVLPEERGVVVVVPSKQHRDYGDPWTSRRMDEANRHSYWLIRNGERVFRMDTVFEVGYRLVPGRDEFTGLFYEERTDYSTTPYTRMRVPLEPGSHGWQQAEEKQGARERHYMKVALILQGLIDRTTVFHPLPAPGISLLKQDSYDAGHVVLIDEDENALGTGRQPFREWLREHNAELRPGMRIVGAFNSEDFRQYRYERNAGHERITPSGAAYPESHVLHHIDERRADGGLVFRYERVGDIVWDDWDTGPRPPKTRATCTVYATDEFIIPVDLVDEADMLAYLQSRTERHNYLSMFPVLKAAIRVKREERAAEEPFRVMLAGRLMAAYDLSEAEARQAVDDLVRWWKFTNKHHRPLVGEGEHEAKAVRMIEEEHAARVKAAASDHPEVIERLKALPGVMLVGRQRDGSYIALAPEHRLLTDLPTNVYAHEYVTKARGKMRERRWVLVSGTRAARWRLLWHDERWERWNRVATAAEHLSDPEVIDAAEQAIAIARDNQAGTEPTRRRNGRDPRPGRVIRVTYSQSDKRFYVFVWPDEPINDDTWRGGTEVVTYVLTSWWKRGPAGAVVVESDGYFRDDTFTRLHRRHSADDRDHWTPPWEERRFGTVVWRDDSMDDEIATACAEVDRQYAERAAKREYRRGLVQSVTEQYDEAAEAAAYARFLDDYADPELWEGHRKTLRNLTMPHRVNEALWALLDTLLDAGVEAEGRTVGDLLAAYDELIASQEDDDEDRLVRIFDSKREALDDEALTGCTFRLPEPEPDEDEDDDEAPDEG